MNKKSQELGRQFVDIRVSQKDACLSSKTCLSSFRQESGMTPFCPSFISSSFAILLHHLVAFYWAWLLFSHTFYRFSCKPAGKDSYPCPEWSLVPPHSTQSFRWIIQSKLKSGTLSEPFCAPFRLLKCCFLFGVFAFFFFFSRPGKIQSTYKAK